MARESTLLENKAQSDLANAQSLVKNDDSGETLGTAMYLAQQCIEKQLKSLVLKLDETMKLDLDQQTLQSLNHDFYSKLYPLYSRYVSHNNPLSDPSFNTTFPKEMISYSELTLNKYLKMFEKTSEHWKSYIRNFAWRSLQWRHSMGVPLSHKDLARLNSNYKLYLIHLAEYENLNFQCFPQLTNYPPLPSLRDAVLNRQLFNNYANEYSRSGVNMAMDYIIDSDFNSLKTLFDPPSKNFFDTMPFELHRVILKMHVVIFGFSILLCQSVPYMSIFPHNLMGRYPEHLSTGENTTDIYKTQIDYVIFHLFITAPHQLCRLRKNSQRIDSLWELGRKHKYW